MPTSGSTAEHSRGEVPAFPQPRATGCPFDPPPGIVDLQRTEGLTRVRLWDGSEPWVVTRHADQRALMPDPRLSADISRPGYPRQAETGGGGSSISFILMDDPEHARLRRMVTGPFAVKRVEARRPVVQRIADELIDEMLAGPRPVDLVEAFALPLPSLVICDLLGVPYADHAFFQTNSKLMVDRTATPDERTGAVGAMAGYLDELVARKQTDPGDDLLSRLTERIAAGELTREGAAQMGVLLLIAGHETTANMIALGTLALLQNPDQLARVRDADDPKVVAGAVEELLRYLSITHTGRRRVALEDIEFGGQTIRAGEGLVFPNDVANRDPAAFDDPHALDVDRDARDHVAFGFGNHQCLGQPLARMELQVVYSTLYRRIPDLALAVDLDDVEFKHDGSVFGVHSLPVTW